MLETVGKWRAEERDNANHDLISGFNFIRKMHYWWREYSISVRIVEEYNMYAHSLLENKYMYSLNF